jgi:hypothetical protein
VRCSTVTGKPLGQRPTRCHRGPCPRRRDGPGRLCRRRRTTQQCVGEARLRDGLRPNLRLSAPVWERGHGGEPARRHRRHRGDLHLLGVRPHDVRVERRSALRSRPDRASGQADVEHALPSRCLREFATLCCLARVRSAHTRSAARPGRDLVDEPSALSVRRCCSACEPFSARPPLWGSVGKNLVGVGGRLRDGVLAVIDRATGKPLALATLGSGGRTQLWTAAHCA